MCTSTRPEVAFHLPQVHRALRARCLSTAKGAVFRRLGLARPSGDRLPRNLNHKLLGRYNGAVIYYGFAKRLHHTVPGWVQTGALFHIRIALDREKRQHPLTSPDLGNIILDSARLYAAKRRWHITLFLLMPDHLHALLSFPRDQSMSSTVGDWKRFHAYKNGVIWQEGYFDHRLRADERGEQLSTKLNYIRRNPVAAGLCDNPENWPYVIDPFSTK